LSPRRIRKGEINAVIIVISPINGKRNALTTPISTPTLTITIENSPRGADNAKAERNDFTFSSLNIVFPRRIPANYIAIVTAINAIAMKM